MNPEYAEKISRAYLQKVGRGLVLSPKDYQYIQRWSSAGIPCEIVLAGIESAFSQPPAAKVRSIGYVAGAVEDLVKKWRQRRVGTYAEDGDEQSVSMDPLKVLLQHIERIQSAQTHPEVIMLFQQLVLDVQSLIGRSQSDTHFDVHQTLESIEHAFLDDVFLAIPALDKAELVFKIEQRMVSEEMMSVAHKAEIRTACTRKRTREYLGLHPLELDSGRGW